MIKQNNRIKKVKSKSNNKFNNKMKVKIIIKVKLRLNQTQNNQEMLIIMKINMIDLKFKESKILL